MKRARASAREDSDDSSDEEGSTVKKKLKPSEDSEDFADPSQVGSEDINAAGIKNEKSASVSALFG